MFLYIVLLAVAYATSPSPAPLLTVYEVKQNVKGYLNLFADFTGVFPGGGIVPAGTYPNQFIVDPSNKRYIFNVTTNVQYTLSNGTYNTILKNYSDPSEGFNCYYQASDTYDEQVASHKTIQLTQFWPQYPRLEYIGLTRGDAGVCATCLCNVELQPRGVQLQRWFIDPVNGFAQELYFQQEYQHNITEPPTGATLGGRLFYTERVEVCSHTHGDTCEPVIPNDLFQLPSYCWDAPDRPEFCEEFQDNKRYSYTLPKHAWTEALKANGMIMSP